MIIAAAQSTPHDGNIEKNLADHCKFTTLAATNKAGLIIFPQLSLTGYQRQNAESLAFTENDPRLSVLQECAVQNQITIVAGAPIRLDGNIFIGSFIISPDQTLRIYTKQFLHEGEEIYFSDWTAIGKENNKYNPQIKLGDELFSLAICADINNPLHPENACKAGSTVYLASIFYTKKGIEEGCSKLKDYAKRYSLNILMSNYAGESWGLYAGGKSSFWTSSMTKESSLGSTKDGILIAKKEKGVWISQALELN